MAKDRLEQHVDTLKERIELMKGHPMVQKFLSLQGDLDAAERIQKAILAEEEEVPVITAPKERKPRKRREAKMPEMNGGYEASMIAGITAAGGVVIGE